MVDLKSLTVGDWLKIVANISAASAAGFATGGYPGLAVALVVNVAALLQTKPGTISVPK